MLKSTVKSILEALGIDAGRVARAVRETAPARRLENRRRASLVTEPAKRRDYVLKTVRDFNPSLINGKPAGTVRAATIWEGVGRFAWLDHANDGLGIELVHLPRATINPAWAYFLADYLTASRGDIALGEYALDRYFQPRFAKARESFRAYCVGAIEDVRDAFDIDVFIMPKLNDDWTIDFINAAKSLGLPVLVDDREGAITPKRLEVVPPRLRALMDVEFDLLCVHNDIHRELFVRAGLPADKIVVNGAPQTDYWHRRDLWVARKDIHPALRDDRFLLLFFSFGPRTYLNLYYGNEHRDWTPLCTDFHEVILELLMRHGDRIQIVNKSGGKPLRDQFPGRQDFMKKAAPYMTPDNYLELDGTYSVFDLLNSADAVLGFQTSGMIEAMFRDVPIVYGAWGPFFEEIKDTLLPLHACEGVAHARSPSELRATLEDLITSKTPWTPGTSQMAAREALREHYFARADGNVSRRLLEHAKDLAGEAAASATEIRSVG
jgi:hypothetical protein